MEDCAQKIQKKMSSGSDDGARWLSAALDTAAAPAAAAASGAAFFRAVIYIHNKYGKAFSFF